ncbi:MAG: ArnT family glycosyltransferase, partial [Planctomycetota bacterium]
LLSAASVFAMARRWLGSVPAWLALLIHLTAPWTLRISLIAYAEGALTFYFTVSVMLALLLRSHGSAAYCPGPQFLCGFLAGCAMACKYTGLVLVVFPIAGFWVWQQRQMRREGLQLPGRTVLAGAVFFVVGTGFAVGPWLLRNLYDTGNPVYPLAASIFPSNDWNPPLDVRWKAAHGASEHSPWLIPRHLLDAALRNTWTSSLLFGLAIPAALLLPRRSREFRSILGFAGWALFTWWAFTHRIDRFWIPVIPLLSICGSALWLLSSHWPWRSLLIAVCAAATLWNVLFCRLPLVGFHAGLMDLDTASRLVIRSDIARLNAQLPEDAKVLMVGEAEVFDAEFSLVYNTVFDDNLFESIAAVPDGQMPGSRRPLRPVAEFLDNCRRQQITHVFVNWSEILRYRLPGSYGYSSFVQPARFEELVQQQALLPPQVLIRRDWTAFSPAERQEVLSWESGSGLVQGDQFSGVLIYRVAPAGPDLAN